MTCNKLITCVAGAHYRYCLSLFAGMLGPTKPINQLKESVLEEAQRLIYGDRRQEYGHPLDDYTRTAGMVNAAFAHVFNRPLTPEEVMLIMVLVKVSRYQETAKRDTLVDMAGYCGIIGEAKDERARRKGTPTRPLATKAADPHA